MSEASFNHDCSMNPTSYLSIEQLLLPFSAVRNENFLSNHWLEHRLPLEPEWAEYKDEAKAALNKLVELWEKEKDRVDKYGDEAGLEHAFIQPVLQILGWHVKYQTFVQGRKPDYALFQTDSDLEKALNVDRKSSKFWDHATIVADAKAWHVNLDRPVGKGSKREYPPEQIEWYLDRTRLDFGILTNGKLWRLVPRDVGRGNPRFQTFLEVDIDKLLTPLLGRQMSLTGDDLAEFQRFYFFFSPVAFGRVDARDSLINRAIAGSSEYRLGVSEDLKERVFEGLRLCMEGFFSHSPNGLDPGTHIWACRQNSLVLLYRLLFVMFAEDRALLPYRINRTYTKNRSLARFRDSIATQLDQVRSGRSQDFSDVSTAIWDELVDLFDLVNDGKSSYQVTAFNGGLFNPDDHTFLGENAIADWHMSRVIDQLGRAADPDRRELGLFRVDYRDLAIQHLGSVYEGLVELKPKFADEDMIVAQRAVKGKSSQVVVPKSKAMPKGYLATEELYQKGSVFLVTDKGERRSYGSYYTPDHIVDHIVSNVLGDKCAEISTQLKSEVDDLTGQVSLANSVKEKQAFQARLEELKGNFDDRVLRMKVLDPAMGSGHFLIRACQYLAEEVATHPYTRDLEADALGSEENLVTFWKRRIVESCIYGVDINPMAVELAKVALWLDCAESFRPLSFLDHHLRIGNSLVSATVSRIGALPDAPPIFREAFEKQMTKMLPKLLKTLGEIAELPSSSIRKIKQKERLFSKKFEAATRAVKAVADARCLYVFAQDEPPFEPTDYHNAISNIETIESIEDIQGAQEALESVGRHDYPFFHWELEFPEVFFGADGQPKSGGFDCIIGNPPYDVISELEMGRDVSGFKAFLASELVYRPSRRGKNNLYKVFLCKAVDLLGQDGRLGFIVPMPLLGDDQAADLRRFLTTSGSLTSIHAFPQKDDPNKRVFRDAKLSTVVVCFQKTSDEQRKTAPFVSFTHPANTIESESPRIELRTSALALYDPINHVIPSCAQTDWDLAVKIFQSGRVKRLGVVCESFQGEVNETNERKRGAIDAMGETEVLRGASITLYAVREASQGEIKYLNETKFLEGKSESSKAYHSQESRIGFQRSSPQNNFRRLISAPIAAGSFCFDTVSYVPESKCAVPTSFLLALLNSKLLDWYFRLGSTNSKVNEYQFKNLPCPVAHDKNLSSELTSEAKTAISNLDFTSFEKVCEKLSKSFPFDRAVYEIIDDLVNRIVTLEERRGAVSKRDRSALDDSSIPYQAMVDSLLYHLAGLSSDEVSALESRLQDML